LQPVLFALYFKRHVSEQCFQTGPAHECARRYEEDKLPEPREIIERIFRPPGMASRDFGNIVSGALAPVNAKRQDWIPLLSAMR
jgi:hypothetical protein